MSTSQPPEWVKNLLGYHGKRPESLVSGGMESLCPLIPQNVIVRVDSNSSIIPKETYIHRRMILKTILSGKLNAVIDGLIIPMETGDSVLFFPFQLHSSIDAENFPRHSFIAISFTIPDENIPLLQPLKNRLLKLSGDDLVTLKDIAEAFYRDDKFLHSRALLKLSGILLNQLEKYSGAEDMGYPDAGNDIHRNICDFIRKNFDKKLSLKSLAAQFGYSPENVRKIFQRYYPGLTPGKLISRLQMQEAVKLLENTNNPIGDIAEKCGFSDIFTFSKKFRKMTGLSPRKYRASLTHCRKGDRAEISAETVRRDTTD